MSIDIFNSMIPQNAYATDHRKVAYATEFDSPLLPPEAIDYFSNSDTETAKNAGGIVLGGLCLRKLLQKWTNNMFAKFFNKSTDVDSKELLDISLKMLKDKGLMKAPQKITAQDGTIFADNLNQIKSPKNIKLIIENESQNAHFDMLNNEIRVSKKTLLSLPHEIGHAVEEHSTTWLKKLQRSRGNYATLALILYALGRNKSKDPEGKQSIMGKIQNILHKYNILIPLLAFSPELITEFAASKIGINYLKQAKAPQKLISAAKKHYAVAFCTYLALPLFTVMDNFIFKKAAEQN